MARKQPVKSVARTWASQADFELCTRGPGIDNARSGVCLARTMMLQDERGMTHINNTEILSEKVWARKDFVLAAGDIADGKLYFYRRGDRHPYESDGETMSVTVNGRRLKPVRELASTGWSYVNVPAEALQKGLNTFVFSGGGRLLVENSSYPNRSARSVDGGATWDYEHLGEQGMNDGEYLVRLRLDRYPAVVALTSGVIDLAALAAEEGIYPQMKWARMRLEADVRGLEPMGFSN